MSLSLLSTGSIHKCYRIIERHGFAPYIPLNEITLKILYKINLRIGLNTFKDNIAVKKMTHGTDRIDKVSVHFSLFDIINKTLVDFKKIDGKILKSCKGCITRSEIIESDLNTPLFSSVDILIPNTPTL